MRPKPVTPCMRFSNNDPVRRALLLTLPGSFPEGCDQYHRERGTFRFLGGRPRLRGVKPESLHFARNPLKTRPKFFSQLCRSFPPFGAEWSHDRQAEIDAQRSTSRPQPLRTGSLFPRSPRPRLFRSLPFYSLLAIGYWLLATGYWLLATGYRLPASLTPDLCL